MLEKEPLSKYGKWFLDYRIDLKIYQTHEKKFEQAHVSRKFYNDFFKQNPKMSLPFCLDWEQMSGHGDPVALFKSALDLTFYTRDGEFFTAHKEAFDKANLSFKDFRDLLHELPEYRDKLEQDAQSGKEVYECLVEALSDKEKRDVLQKAVDHGDKKSDT